jgi:hypothetical protein
VVGGIAGLAVVVCCLFRRRKRQHRNKPDEEPYAGKPELHADSLPGVPPAPAPQELDAKPQSPKELGADGYRLGPVAEMPANEVPAREMGVKAQYHEMDVESQKPVDQARQ